MEYKIKDIDEFSRNSRVLKLLKTPYVLFFLHKEFVESNREAIPEMELVENWQLFRNRYPEASQNNDCAEYIRTWMSNEKLWVYRQIEGEQWKYRLSKNAFQAFHVYEELNGEVSDSLTVPVNEYFAIIVNSLRELSNIFDSDRKKRVQAYDKQILEHTEKIKELEEKRQIAIDGGALDPPDEYHTVELFSSVLKVLKQMPMDARMLVDDLNNVYEQLKKDTQDDTKTKNEIMQAWIDGRKTVEKSVSVKAFKNLLGFFENEELHTEVLKNLRECKNYPFIGDVARMERPEDMLLRLNTFIVKAGVAYSHMYHRIHELITVENFQENRSIRALLGEISDLMLEYKKMDIDLPPLKIEGKPAKPCVQIGTPRINLQVSEEPSVLNVSEAKPMPAIILEDVKVDEQKLIENLDSCMTEDGADLSEVIKKHPLSDKMELEEILSYIEIDSLQRTFSDEQISFTHHNRIHDVTETFSIPNIRFRRKDDSNGKSGTATASEDDCAVMEKGSLL